VKRALLPTSYSLGLYSETALAVRPLRPQTQPLVLATSIKLVSANTEVEWNDAKELAAPVTARWKRTHANSIMCTFVRNTEAVVSVLF
jgi:hypothetical protein